MNEDLKMEIMKAKILELREKSAEATIQMMQRDGKLKKRIRYIISLPKGRPYMFSLSTCNTHTYIYTRTR
jgi:hypothetical protein